MADALPLAVNAVLNKGAAAFRTGRPRTDHHYIHGTRAIITWQHGYDAAAAASIPTANHARAALRRIDRAQAAA